MDTKRSHDKTGYRLTEAQFEELLRKPASQIEPSVHFDAGFWQKVAEREREPWAIRLFRDLEAWVPTPSLSGALAVLVIAFLVGGAGGVYSVRNTPPGLDAQRTSIQYLSGFREFKGVPTSSVAAAYLNSIKENHSP